MALQKEIIKMITAASNQIILKVKSKYAKNFSDLVTRAALAQGATVHLEDLVSIVGEIVSLPRVVHDTGRYKGFSTKDLKVGDTAIFSFHVIYYHFLREPDEPQVHKNRISYQGKEFWQCDITHLFGVIRGEEIIMVNGYVMAAPFLENKIITQPTDTKFCTHSPILNIGNPKDGYPNLKLKRGDTIYFNPIHAQKYQINDKPFIILQQHQILGKQKVPKLKVVN